MSKTNVTWKQAAAAVVVMLLLDSVWIGTQKRMYERLVMGVQHSAMRVKPLMAVLAYLFLAAGLVLFALPLYRVAWWMPFAFGLILYGTFNFTNLAMFKDYSLVVGILDTCWGGALMLLTCMITFALPLT